MERSIFATCCRRRRALLKIGLKSGDSELVVDLLAESFNFFALEDCKQCIGLYLLTIFSPGNKLDVAKLWASVTDATSLEESSELILERIFRSGACDKNIVYNDSMRENVWNFELDMKVWKTILEHFAILEVFGIPFHPELMRKIRYKEDLADYLDLCLEELDRAKNNILGVSSITVFDLLILDQRKLEKLVANRSLVENYESSRNSFTIYEPRLQRRMKRAGDDRKTWQLAIANLSAVLPVTNVPYLIVEKILGYFDKGELLTVSGRQIIVEHHQLI